ncbi:hypothetical protein [Mycolicibacterium iranicum]|uniref:Uncharacterized protein n=1 Tax=Mycolicibacterium iranicum TaxID=912594 RepID=A0A178LYP1_MYCIR|nr:hypothetical protein [Mycolicibacterium iranicum]OAN39938.1 hypothetical protein A4X20_16490 [Mycolicibacterium iranicum]
MRCRQSEATLLLPARRVLLSPRLPVLPLRAGPVPVVRVSAPPVYRVQRSTVPLARCPLLLRPSRRLPRRPATSRRPVRLPVLRCSPKPVWLCPLDTALPPHQQVLRLAWGRPLRRVLPVFRYSIRPVW